MVMTFSSLTWGQLCIFGGLNFSLPLSWVLPKRLPASEVIIELECRRIISITDRSPMLSSFLYLLPRELRLSYARFYYVRYLLLPDWFYFANRLAWHYVLCSESLCGRYPTASLGRPCYLLHFASQRRILTLQVHHDLRILLLVSRALPNVGTYIALFQNELFFRLLALAIEVCWYPVVPAMVQIVSSILTLSLRVVVHELVEGAVCAFVGWDLRLGQVLVLTLTRRWIY